MCSIDVEKRNQTYLTRCAAYFSHFMAIKCSRWLLADCSILTAMQHPDRNAAWSNPYLGVASRSAVQYNSVRIIDWIAVQRRFLFQDWIYSAFSL